MRFRTRVREIEAVQYHEGDFPKGSCICTRHLMGIHLHTMHEGQMVQLRDGDWIVPEPDGDHFYPIKPDVMEKNYEPV